MSLGQTANEAVTKFVKETVDEASEETSDDEGEASDDENNEALTNQSSCDERSVIGNQHSHFKDCFLDTCSATEASTWTT